MYSKNSAAGMSGQTKYIVYLQAGSTKERRITAAVELCLIARRCPKYRTGMNSRGNKKSSRLKELQTVKKVLRAAARFKQGFAACGKTHKNPRHVRGFLYKPPASVPVRARAAAGILDRTRGFDRRLFENAVFRQPQIRPFGRIFLT